MQSQCASRSPPFAGTLLTKIPGDTFWDAFFVDRFEAFGIDADGIVAGKLIERFPITAGREARLRQNAETIPASGVASTGRAQFVQVFFLGDETQ